MRKFEMPKVPALESAAICGTLGAALALFAVGYFADPSKVIEIAWLLFSVLLVAPCVVGIAWLLVTGGVARYWPRPSVPHVMVLAGLAFIVYQLVTFAMGWVLLPQLPLADYGLPADVVEQVGMPGLLFLVLVGVATARLALRIARRFWAPAPKPAAHARAKDSQAEAAPATIQRQGQDFISLDDMLARHAE